MYDPLLEEDPWVKSLQEKSRAEGLAEGRLYSVRDSLLTFIQTNFPQLSELAKTRAMQTNQWKTLNVLFVQIVAAKNEQTAREILEQFTAS